MYVRIFFILVIFITKIFGISIPFIPNVFLQSSTYLNLNITVRLNSSCEQCLCEQFISNNNIDYLALNCFSNGTCQFFQSFPLSYKIQSSSGSQLYFLQNQFPNTSQCCMPNIAEVLSRLQSVISTTISLTFQPAAFGYDEANTDEAVVIGWNPGSLYWFNPITTMFIRNSVTSTSLTVALYNNQTFTATGGVSIVYVRDSQTNLNIEDINYSSLVQIRKIIFINNGQTLIIPTQSNYSLTIINANSPVNYTIQQEIVFPLANAHGIAKVNDTLLYVSTWSSRSIVAYKYENFTWTYKMFVNSTATGDGSHLAVDECGRVWFVNTQFGLRIFDPSGVEVGNWNMSLSSTNWIYDILLLPNYVLSVSYYQQQKIIHYDPQFTCF